MNATPEQPVLLEFNSGLAVVRLNRPAHANSVDLEMANQLLEVAIRCEQEASVRAVLLTGRGTHFCAGGDIDVFGRAAASRTGIASELRRITARMHEAILVLSRMSKPLITAINGAAAGAGLALALISDFAIAARSAKFRVAFTAIGLSPDCATTFILPRLVGLRRAQELIFLNPTISADQALQMALISRVVADADLERESDALARALASSATMAIGNTRRLMVNSLSQSLEQQLDAEARSLAELGNTADAREGIDAFLGKRNAQFFGS